MESIVDMHFGTAVKLPFSQMEDKRSLRSTVKLEAKEMYSGDTV